VIMVVTVGVNGSDTAMEILWHSAAMTPLV
jgi:hypothetical protein